MFESTQQKNYSPMLHVHNKSIDMYVIATQYYAQIWLIGCKACKVVFCVNKQSYNIVLSQERVTSCRHWDRLAQQLMQPTYEITHLNGRRTFVTRHN